MIKIVGVGIENGDVTEKGLRAIAGADRVFSRVKLWFDTEALGGSYTGGGGFFVLGEGNPSRENGVQKRPQAFLNPEIKIIFPLNMPKATRRAFLIILSVRPAAPVQ